MGEAGVWGTFHSGTGAVAGAIEVAAKKGTAAHDFFGRAWFIGVKTVWRSGWIVGGAVGIIVRAVPILAPFPDIAGHVVEGVGIGGKRSDGGSVMETIGGRVFFGEQSLPDVGLPLTVREEFCAPGVGLLIEAAASGVFPFGLGGKLFSGPLGISECVLPADMDDGMIFAIFDG